MERDRPLDRRAFLASAAAFGAAVAGRVFGIGGRGPHDARWRTRPARLAPIPGARAFLVQPSGRGAYQLNDTGALLWRLCDGRHTERELVQALAVYGGIEEARAAQDVRAFLSTMMDEGLVSRA